jgi:hypothetical protein
VLVVNQQDAERALAMPAAITAMRDVLLALDEGRAHTTAVG